MAAFDNLSRVQIGQLIDHETDKAVTVSPSSTLKAAAAKLKDTPSRSIVVVDETKKLVGILTQSDFTKAVEDGLSPDTKVSTLLKEKDMPTTIDKSVTLSDFVGTVGPKSTVIIHDADATYVVKRSVLADRVERNLL